MAATVPPRSRVSSWRPRTQSMAARLHPAMQPGSMAMRHLRRLSAAALLLGLLPAPARGDLSASLQCRAGTVLVRTDSRTCPTERGRPAAVVQRACCQGRNGKTRCMPYPECPTRSPS